MRGNGKRSLLRDVGESPPSLSCLPECPYAAGMRLWNMRVRHMILEKKVSLGVYLEQANQLDGSQLQV